MLNAFYTVFVLILIKIGDAQGNKNETTSVQSQNVTAETIKYRFGIRIPGDKYITDLSDSSSYPAPKDFRLTLRYPKNGTGDEVLTCIRILVAQTSNIGQASLISGGIEKNFAEVLIEANQTWVFDYVVSFYGY